MKRKSAILFATIVLAALTFAQNAGAPPGRSDPSYPAQMPNLNSKGTPAGHTLSDITITNGPKIGPQDTNATIAWNTNKNAATYVRYGTDPNYLNQKYWQSGGRMVHTATLSNLQPGTRYYFAVMKYGDTVGTSGEFQTTGTAAASNAVPEPINLAQAAPPAASSEAPQQPATAPAAPEPSPPAEQTTAPSPKESTALPQTASPLPLLGLLALGSLAIGVITLKR
jgi:Purple acid Phosphatase, N-terminal domain